jgi:hypothetical protein
MYQDMPERRKDPHDLPTNGYHLARIKMVLGSYPTAVSEFWGGLFSIIWGLRVLVPLPEHFDLNPNYVAFSSLLPWWFWGIWMINLGAMQIYAMNRVKSAQRVAASVGLTFTWFFISVFAIISNATLLGSSLYLAMALKEFWIVVRVVPPPHKDLPFAPKREADSGIQHD